MHISTLKKLSKSAGIIILLALALAATIFGGYKVAGNMAKASSCSAQKVSSAQVTPNSAVIAWESSEVTQGRVEYGTTATSLSFTAPEATSGKVHNVPLTLLTPNTSYYYLIAIGDNRCDSTGQSCSSNCIPWSFSTTSVIQPTVAALTTIAPLPTSFPTSVAPVTETTTVAPTLSGSSPTAVQSPPALSTFCKYVEGSIGQNKDSIGWAAIKQYDIDGNGFINGIDVLKCQSSGK